MNKEFEDSGGVWKIYRIEEIFTISTPKKKFNANTLTFDGIYPYVARGDKNNGVRGYITEDSQYLNPAKTISFGQDTATMFYQKNAYFTGDKIKVFSFLHGELSSSVAQFIITAMKKSFSNFTWGSSSFNEKILKQTEIILPTIDNKIAIKYMHSYMNLIETERIETLEVYLSVTNLKDYKLTEDEESALSQYGSYEWKLFNLEKLFGKATRGRRLKSSDRIYGTLPFVTAGETDMGISAFVGNDTIIFSENTITIDMFGSAKYRNYKYGADDHVAVVHTEKLSKWSNLFLTTCIHNVANSGKFSYSRNFYAKDANELNILLPVEDGEIDYNFMNRIGRAIEKMVIKDVVQWSDKRLEISKKEKNNV